MEYFSGDFCLCTCVIKDPDSDSYKTIRNASIIQLSSEFIKHCRHVTFNRVGSTFQEYQLNQQ